MKKALFTMIALVAFAAGVFATSAFNTYQKQQEAKRHPRIEKAIDSMKDAVDYMQKAPDDFGGHKAAAIADTKAALKSLHQALGYSYKAGQK